MANTPKKSKQQIPVVFQRMQEQVTAMLAVLHNKIGLEYAIYNEEHGINVATKGMTAGKPAKRTRKQTVAFGAYAAIYKPLIQNLQPDGYATIPVSGYNVQHMQSAISAWCSSNWGNGSYTCMASKDKRSLELWRFPEGVNASILKGTPDAEIAALNVEAAPRIPRTVRFGPYVDDEPQDHLL
jgi:hypothetical protein